MFGLILLTVGIVLIAMLSNIFFRIYQNYCKVKQIPGSWQIANFVKKVPILSPHFFLGSHKSMYELIKEKGDPKTMHTVRVSTFKTNLISICDRELMKEFLVAKGNNFVKDPEMYDTFNLFGANILSALDSNGETWKNHHRVASAAFSPKNLEYIATVAYQSVDLMRETKWDKELKKKNDGSGVLIDSTADFSDITLDILGKGAFGLDFSIFETDNPNPEGKLFRKSMEITLSKSLIITRFLGKSTLAKLAKSYFNVNEAELCVSNTLDRVIDERIKECELKIQNNEFDQQEESRRDLLSMLVEANVLQKGLLSRSELKSDAFIFSLAGHETTSSSTSYVCYELAKRPELQKKARDEVDRVIGKRPPSFEDYNEMHYVNAVIMETLRLHPPVVNVFRLAKKTTTLGDITIPKGSTVMINIFSTNRNEKYWDKPHEFIPERFPMNAEEQGKIQHDFTWIPFSMGNRKCIGYKFAEIEAFSILCRILQFYELELLNNESDPNDMVTDVPGITVRPGNLKISLKPRRN